MQSKLTRTAFVFSLVAMIFQPVPSIARDEHVHRGHRCDGGSGIVGTVAGGAGGAVLGKVLIGGPIAIVAGGVGGALLGRHIDKKKTRKRHGCAAQQSK